MNRKALQWLYDELPTLVSEGVLTGEGAERLRQHYGEGEPRSGRRIALTVCSILGAVLIGAGVILLLAHNWDDLSRAARTALSLVPLAAAQALAFWALATGRRSAAWREGLGTYLSLAVGAAIALVAQTYNIPGDTGSFLLTWMLLILPAVYLLDAVVPAVIYLAGMTAWAGCEQSARGHSAWFWVWMALALPYFAAHVRRNPYSPASAVLGWSLAICLGIGMGIVLSPVLENVWIVLYSLLLAAFYLAGTVWFRNSPTAWQNPLHSVGAMGIAGLSLLLSFKWLWHEFDYNHLLLLNFARPEAWAALLVLGILLVLATALLPAVRRLDPFRLVYGAMPAMAVGGQWLHSRWDSRPPAVLFSLYLFALGLTTLVSGIRRGRIGTVNAGLLMLAALIVARFFDSDLSFVVRGLAFVGVGVGFLVANVVMIKRMKGGAQ